MLLMGQDAVHFNRQFARLGLSETIHRLSPAVEENTLAGAAAPARTTACTPRRRTSTASTVESAELGTPPRALRAVG